MSSPRQPPSIRSVSSNSSLASTVSLARRPRTRTRAKTVVGTPPPSSPDALLLPPRSAPNAPSSSASSHDTDSRAGEVTLVAPLPHPSPMPSKPTKASQAATSLPPIEISYKPPLSAFSRDPELTPNVRDSFSTQKSSTSSFYPPSTSTFSASTSPGSPHTVEEEAEEEPIVDEQGKEDDYDDDGDDERIHQHDHQPDISLLPEDIDEMQGYDGDDVAYRLRLLVNNNYFLPPAHMKPSPQDFAASMNAKKQQKSSATFLDIFRVGKSKSKPSSPVVPTPGPVLRTTSDSITSAKGTQSHHAPQPPHMSSHPAANGVLDRRRVVVVRERMPDIGLAAKQAEQELKARYSKRDQGPDMWRQPGPGQLPPPVQRQDVGDVIDPTDSVDVPLPASNYPFAVQASELRGLGVQDSVGAALLAEHLPPNSPKSQNTSKHGRDDWRKQLLHEAVHHSLGNSPNESVLSDPPGTSSPMLATPRVNGLSSRSPTPGTRANRLQQHIAEPHTLETEDLSFQEDVKKEGSIRQLRQNQVSPSTSTGKFLTPLETSDPRLSHYLPSRAITPISNITPLTPAPRKQNFRPPYSISDSDLQEQHDSIAADLSTSTSSKSKLRRSMSTPMLSDAYDALRQFGMSPPPPPLPLTRGSSQLSVLSQSFETHREISSRTSVFSSHSHLDEVEPRAVNGSPRLSALGARPSLSSYSLASLSPTTSAFQEILNHGGDKSLASSIRRASIETRSEETHTRSAASPPPRPSTSIAHIALRPPPRSSSLNHTSFAPSKSVTSLEPRIEVSAASPTRMDLPHNIHASTSRHTTRNLIPLSLKIPPTTDTVAIHSPAPSSPTSFFDTLQSQHNAMDDLDSSESEEEEGDEDGEEEDDDRGGEEFDVSRPQPPVLPPRSPFIIDARARANSTVSTSPNKPSNSIMRLGNFSTPYVGRGQYNHYHQHHQFQRTSTDRMRALPVGVVDHKKALGFTPARAPFFSERKGGLGHGNDISTSLLVQAKARQAQEKNMDIVPSSGPSGSGGGGGGGGETRATDHPPLPRMSDVEAGVTSPTNPLASSDIRRPATADQVMSSTMPVYGVGQSSKPEAIRRLDGMLVQHMEAEKDRIRKIAGALKSSSQVNLVAGHSSAGGGGTTSLSSSSDSKQQHQA